jgi:hypothetical protein
MKKPYLVEEEGRIRVTPAGAKRAFKEFGKACRARKDKKSKSMTITLSDADALLIALALYMVDCAMNPKKGTK